MSQKKLSKYLILTLLMLLWLPFMDCLGQAPGFEGDTNDVAAPLDGGLGFLLAAGIGYRIHQQAKEKKKPAPEQEQAE